MSSNENTLNKNTNSLPLLKQRLDNFINQFEVLNKELLRVFGMDINYSGHATNYENQLDQLNKRFDQLDFKIQMSQELQDSVNNIEQDNDDLDDRIRRLNDRIRSLERNFEYIIQKNDLDVI